MNNADVRSRGQLGGCSFQAMTHFASFGALVGLVTITLALAVMQVAAAAEETAWQDIAGELMSPACPGRTLLNCTSEHAGQWQELIKQKVAQGLARNEIMQYFVNMGGEEVLASPPKRGFTLTVWLLPAFAIINGAGLIILLTTRWAKRVRELEDPPPLSAVPDPPRASSAATDPYLSRVRRDLQGT